MRHINKVFAWTLCIASLGFGNTNPVIVAMSPNTLQCTSGTTATAIISPEGIVLAIDSLLVTKQSGSPEQRRMAPKLLLIQNQFAIATIGVVTARDTSTNESIYEFSNWVRTLEQQLPNNISIEDFVGIVERESTKQLAFFDAAINSCFTKSSSLFLR